MPISRLSDEQLGRLFRAIFAYHMTDTRKVDDDIAIAFDFFVNQFEIDQRKYSDVCQKRKRAIEKRWRNSGDTNVYKSIEKNTNVYKSIQDYTKHSDNVNGNGNDNDNGSPNNGDINSSSGSSQARACEGEKGRKPEKSPEDGLFDELHNSPVWIEHVQMQAKCTEAQVHEDIEAFRLWCHSSGQTEHYNENDLKHHFAVWLMQKADREQKQKKQNGAYLNRDEQRRNERKQRQEELAAEISKLQAADAQREVRDA